MSYLSYNAVLLSEEQAYADPCCQNAKIESTKKRVRMSLNIQVSLARTISANHLHRNDYVHRKLLFSCIHP